MALPKPKIQELPRSIDRLTFFYLERCSINVDGGAILAWRDGNKLSMPASSITCLVLGPGSKITHEAMKLIGQSGTTVLWTGADQTRLYACGAPLANSTEFIDAQARIVSNPHKRVKCAKRMYSIRFPGDDFTMSDMQKLRGKEGRRMKDLYRSESKRTGVPWDYRRYRVGDIDYSDVVNRCITSGTQILYAVELGVCHALGVSPALGVIHMSTQMSFVYDMADLYKSELVIPTAFDIAKEHLDDEPEEVDLPAIDHDMRVRVRQQMVEKKLLSRTVKDLRWLLLGDKNSKSPLEIKWVDPDQLMLWDKVTGSVEAGVNYGEPA